MPKTTSFSPQVRITGVTSSIRRGFEPHAILDLLALSESLDSFRSVFHPFAERMTSSDIATAVSLLGAKLAGSNIDLIDAEGVARHKRSLTKESLDYDAICYGTSIRFGGPSSTFYSFLQHLERYETTAKNRPTAICCVGARSHGGQDLAIQAAGWRRFEQGAVLSGEGPPHSQCGGTLIARYPENALDDVAGLESCVRTGGRLHRAALLTGKDIRPETTPTVVLVCADSQMAEVASRWTAGLRQETDKTTRLSVLDLTARNFSDCNGCRTCPNESPRLSSWCKHVDLSSTYELLCEADGIVFCIANGRNLDESILWRRFMERTRCLRRAGYLLSDRIAALAVISAPLIDSRYLAPFMPYVLKHDMLMMGPCIDFSRNPVTSAIIINRLHGLCSKSAAFRATRSPRLTYSE